VGAVAQNRESTDMNTVSINDAPAAIPALVGGSASTRGTIQRRHSKGTHDERARAWLQAGRHINGVSARLRMSTFGGYSRRRINSSSSFIAAVGYMYWITLVAGGQALFGTWRGPIVRTCAVFYLSRGRLGDLQKLRKQLKKFRALSAMHSERARVGYKCVQGEIE